MKKFLMLSLFFFWSHVAQAQGEKTLYIVSNGLLVADWLTTHELVIHRDYHETNIILGRHPSQNDINVYFSFVLAANYLLYKTLPLDSKKSYLYAVILIETTVVGLNTAQLLSFNYNF